MTTEATVNEAVEAATTPTCSVVDVLVDAREFLSEPARWTQHTYARDSEGKGVHLPFASGAAVGEIGSCCAMGAARLSGTKLCPDDTHFAFDGSPAIKALSETLKRNDKDFRVHRFNDSLTTTHEDILALFDETIAHERAQETQTNA